MCSVASHLFNMEPPDLVRQTDTPLQIRPRISVQERRGSDSETRATAGQSTEAAAAAVAAFHSSFRKPPPDGLLMSGGSCGG